MQKGLNTRYTIYEILKILKNYPVNFEQVFLEKIKYNKFSKSDLKMIQNVVLNSMRHHLLINTIIKKFTKNIKFSSNIYYLLLSSITQLIVLDFKEFAVVNSTVELSKDRRIKTSTSLVNGLLRNIIRNKENILKYKINFNQLPIWFTKKTSSWSKDQKKEFLKNICEEPNTHLVFKNKKHLENLSIQTTKTTTFSAALKKSLPIDQIPGYKEGHWWIQDLATMLPLYFFGNINNKITADLCAAPGGKTFQLLNYGGKVEAYEKNKVRAKLMQENLKRLNFNCKINIQDVLTISDKKRFDLIVLDAPCSSIGTIRRHPEIFFRKIGPNFNKIISLQKKLLEKAINILNINGKLIYMVCSFLEEEGKNQINNFLERNNNFSLERFSSQSSVLGKSFIDKNGFYFVLPSKLENGILIDGFFAAKLIKNDK